MKRNQNGNVHFSSMIDNFFGKEFESLWNERVDRPAVNIAESEKGFRIELAIPGLKKEDFEINVKEGVLTISSKKQEDNNGEQENGGMRYTKREFSFSSFSRSFKLPKDVDEEQISAKYSEGVLRVEIPKKEKVEPKVQLVEIQ